MQTQVKKETKNQEKIFKGNWKIIRIRFQITGLQNSHYNTTSPIKNNPATLLLSHGNSLLIPSQPNFAPLTYTLTPLGTVKAHSFILFRYYLLSP